MPWSRETESANQPRPKWLRDYLYVDAERVRLLLAQLEGGVVDKVVERVSGSDRREARGTVLGSYVQRAYSEESATERARSLEDALFALFEKAADEVDLFANTADCDVAEKWYAGVIHRQLVPGQLIRSTGPTQLLDTEHFKQRVDRSVSAIEIAARFSEGLPEAKSKGQQERELRRLVTNLMGGISPDQARRIGDFAKYYLGGEVSVRQLPAGREDPRAAFVGHLLNRPGYLQDERDALFAKYGSGPSEWTLVAQIASVPEQPATTASEAEDGEPNEETEEEVGRIEFEKVALDLMQSLEAAGIAGAPMFPSITVTPIAIYREVPTPS